MQDVNGIADYALIGDSRSAALVSRDGSIDWLCLPNFDSPACFAALVGDETNGCWRIGPEDAAATVSRRYRQDTLILETRFATGDGEAELVDFMPTRDNQTNLVRRVTGLSGSVRMRMDLTVRLDYGRLVPWVDRTHDGSWTIVAGRHLLRLQSPLDCRGDGKTAEVDFTVSEGESLTFVLTHGASYEPLPEPVDPDEALERTEAYWKEWAGKCTYDGPWRDAVVRSLVTLKALTFEPSGGIVAAPTTSLPERAGGERNWDYRFCWLRDATFTLLSLLGAGYVEEADAWRGWLVRAIGGDASQLQPIYTVLGENRMGEWEADWLAGFEGARPVRIGNAAFEQVQLDNFGEVLDALHQARCANLEADPTSWSLQKSMLDHLEKQRDAKDCGIWEVRGPPRHFTHSKVMMWVAFNRGVSAVEAFGLDGPADRWRALRDDLHDEICERGFSAGRNAFVQAYDNQVIDASALLFTLVGFLPPEDERIRGTLEAIEEDLLTDGFVQRYDTRRTDDGLPPGEGAFLACNFWYVDNLILQGRRDEARSIFERLLDLQNDVGLLAEEYDPRRKRQMGNFPQALSHLCLIDTALNFHRTRGPARERSERTGGD